MREALAPATSAWREDGNAVPDGAAELVADL